MRLGREGKEEKDRRAEEDIGKRRKKDRSEEWEEDGRERKGRTEGKGEYSI